MKASLFMFFGLVVTALASPPPKAGLASWYGESHRGKLMANGKKFDPSKLTAASWSHPLGARVRVSLKDPARSVIVTITDRGPARSLVREGRIIDLAQAAFERLASSSIGLVAVTVEPVR
jgi:rare lipoprotein A